MGWPAAQIVLKTHDTEYEGDLIEYPHASWITKNYNWVNNPLTGQPWTWDEINALQAGVRLTGDEEDEEEYCALCTQVCVVVTYEPIPVKLRAIEKY